MGALERTKVVKSRVALRIKNCIYGRFLFCIYPIQCIFWVGKGIAAWRWRFKSDWSVELAGVGWSFVKKNGKLLLVVYIFFSQTPH